MFATTDLNFAGTFQFDLDGDSYANNFQVPFYAVDYTTFLPL